MINWGKVPLASVLPFIFDSFDGGTGASITLTGLAVGDIFIYKGTSMTQRASTSGFTLLETDGIDLDTNTGIHGFSIDTGDNTDAGFFVAGSFYTVVVASVTIDAQTVNFVAGTFWLGPTLTVAGVDEVDVTHVAGTAQTAGDLAAMITAVDDLVDTEVTAIKTKTDYLPSVTAGAAGGLMIAGSNAATTFATLTVTGASVFTGNVSYAAGIDITQSTFNGNGISIAAEATGSGSGLKVRGGATGYEIDGNLVGNLSGSIGSLGTTAKANVNTEVDTALADINLDHLVGTATAIPAIVAGTYIDQMMDDGTAVYDRTTDSLQAVRYRGDSAWTTGAGGSDRLLMVDTTIATLASQTSFTLTAGSADNNAYLNCTIVIEDVSTSTQKAVGLISAYTGATKTVTLKYDPAIFVMAVTDKVYILAENSLKSTAQNRQLDVTATGAAGIDWGNVENPTTAVDLSATDIQLCDTTTTAGSVTGLTASNLDAAISTRATPAQVNTEVLDVLNTDTFAEPGQEAPGATVSLVKKIGYIYKSFRNKFTQDATTAKLYADDGTTVDQKATVSDDATTFTRGEMGTGP